MQWQVDDVMTREVITVAADAPIAHVAAVLDRHGIGAVPVTSGTGAVLGVVSQAALLARVTGADRGGRARDTMTVHTVRVGADASLAQAARTMHAHHVRRLLVTDARGRLLGIVSQSDLLRPYARDGAEVGREAEDVLRRRLWTGPEQIRVRMNEGTAVLTGEVGRRSTAGIAGRLVAAVPGVARVVDRIRYEFDDADLARSTVNRTHPFSADPFGSGRPRRRRRSRRHDNLSRERDRT